MLKVLHVVEAFGGGLYTFFESLTSRQANSFEVYVAYGIRPFTHKNFKQCFDSRIQWIEVRNFQRAIGIKDIKAFFELRRIVREVRPDIIHLHSSKAGFLGRWAFHDKRYKIFYTPHGYSFLMKEENRLKRYLYWLIEYFSAQRKAVTVACGEGEYKEALKLSSSCVYVNNGINICRLKPFVIESQVLSPVVCTSGRIIFQKNPKLFNEIACLLPDVKFIWIGDGELRQVLTAGNIEITGWVDPERTVSLQKKAGFFILTSLWEGLPLSLLEAMYLKKVCLVSDVAGSREVIKNGRNGFICRTAEEYVSQINQVLRKEWDWRALTEQSHSDVLKFYNTEVMAANYKKIYEGQQLSDGQR
jgi:glycosyltransferase involved in cell wall biosynthesis